MNMQHVRFRKMHGIGNDFIIIDNREEKIDLNKLPIAKLCHRQLGIGCDQFIVLEAAANADVEMIIFNQDGSRATACGNATRCVASILGKETVVIKVADRTVHAKNEADGSVTVNMGKPELAQEVLKFKVSFPYDYGYLVNVGNPHLVFLVQNEVDDNEVEKIGKHFEKDVLFPQGVNVNFARIMSKNEINLKVWERGAGITLACGTGACATFAVAHRLGVVDSKAKVGLIGGTLTIGIVNGDLFMNGEAKEVFNGIVSMP